MDELIHYSRTYKNKVNGLAKILRYYRRDKGVKNEKMKMKKFVVICFVICCNLLCNLSSRADVVHKTSNFKLLFC